MSGGRTAVAEHSRCQLTEWTLGTAETRSAAGLTLRA